MRRPPVHEWAVLDEDTDPIPGDPDAVALLGAALRETAERIWRQAGEIKALASVESWKSKAADRFRDAAGSAEETLRKAYHRYHIAAQAMGSQVREDSEADWASALERAQKMADKALKDAQTADTDHKAASSKIAALPTGTEPSDPTLTGLKKQQQSAASALGNAKSALQAAKDVRDNAAKAAEQRIHRAITHDGLHDSRWDKVSHSVGDALSDVGHALEDVGETALSDLASIGNAMAHDAGAVMEVLGGIGLATLGAGGEIGGVVLDATGIGALLGVPTAVVSAAAITGGLSLAGLGASTIAHDAAGPDRVNMTSDGGRAAGATGTRPRPSRTRALRTNRILTPPRAGAGLRSTTAMPRRTNWRCSVRTSRPIPWQNRGTTWSRTPIFQVTRTLTTVWKARCSTTSLPRRETLATSPAGSPRKWRTARPTALW